MSRQLFLWMTVIALWNTSVIAQQAMGSGAGTNSPEIGEDYSVTFRLDAPHASEVKIMGDWMPANGWVPGSEVMEKDEKGVWFHTTKPLEPELYGYSFMIDSFRTLDPNNPFVSRDVAILTNIFMIGGGEAELYEVNAVPHGSVVRRWYNSPGIDMERRLTIYTPPGYENSVLRYPVLYLLHGAGGDEEAWGELGRSAQIMDNLIAQSMAIPMIVVMPNGNVSQEAAPGEGSEGFYKPQFMVPGTMDGTFEEIFPDIMEFVESSFRVKAEKSFRAVAGLSMGGFHSMHISRYYPNTFDYVGLFSPAILPYQNRTAKAYQDIEGTLIRQIENGYKLYWIGIGKADPLYNNVLDYHYRIEAMEMPHTYHESDGGHTWKNWRVYLSEFVPQLFR